MLRSVIAAGILLVPLFTTASSAIECKPELPVVRTGHWSWRIIDGRQCWYQGAAGMDKASLQWPRPHPLSDPVDKDDRKLLESYWPELPGR